MPQPNIIVIFADDMGYGDMRCNDPACRIPTPNLDRLASRGVRMTDMHAGTALCTPSRYALLTGRFAWRSRLKQGIVWEWDGPVIDQGRLTVAQMLKDHGYRTACIGKWHLGWDWPTKDGTHPNDTLAFGQMERAARHAYEGNIDYTARIAGGPIDRGFDSYFGVDVPNFMPYTWFEDDRLTEAPGIPKPDHLYGNAGSAVPGWSHEAMIPAFTRRAVDLIEASQHEDSPFFLYFPLTSPHSPVVPNEAFKGRSGIGNYGDFVCEIDDLVGRIMDALQRTGQADNTLLVFTSDNGPEVRVPDDEGVYDRLRRTGHASMGPLRGVKRDAWEGGHRMPFIASWPGALPQGAVCEHLGGLVDLMATFADAAGAAVPDGAAEDSVSLLPMWRDPTHGPVRDDLLHASGQTKFVIRRGNWVLIDAPTGGESREPQWFRDRRGAQPHDQPGELFDLDADPRQCVNVYAEHPGVVAQLRARIAEVRAAAPCDPPADGDTDALA